jgi:hypothetical protein
MSWSVKSFVRPIVRYGLSAMNWAKNRFETRKIAAASASV